jgi:hypothetical protein
MEPEVSNLIEYFSVLALVFGKKFVLLENFFELVDLGIILINFIAGVKVSVILMLVAEYCVSITHTHELFIFFSFRLFPGLHVTNYLKDENILLRSCELSG